MRKYKYWPIWLALIGMLCACAGGGGKNISNSGEETQILSQAESEWDDRQQSDDTGELPGVDSQVSSSEGLSGVDSREPSSDGTAAKDSGEELSTETIADYHAAFYREELSDSVKTRITGISYPADNTDAKISYAQLAYVHVLYYDFDGEVQEGELVCNRAIADDLVEIFGELFENQYQIEKIRLVDEYGGDDDASMEDNNTSCFNYRPVFGTNRLSKHAYGLAIDVNPLYNPYVTTRNGEKVVSPEAGSAYADRTKEFAHKIDKDDLCYRLFVRHGFTWGGSWVNSKDYQHFQKEL